LGFWIAAALLRNVWRRYFPEASIEIVVAALFASGLAIALTLVCNIYEVAITCGFAFTMLTLAAIWRAMHEPKQGALWLLLASLAYGLAVGARPSLLFGVIILLIPVVRTWHRASDQVQYRQPGLLFLAAVIPAMLIGAGLMLYNDLRFDNPFEFGWHYQLNEVYRPPAAKPFNLHYFWFNFRDYFLEPLRWNGQFPFLQTVSLPPAPSGYNPQVETALSGIPFTYPLVLLVLAVPLAWKNRPMGAVVILRLFAAALFLLFIICMSTMCLFFTAGIRYELDFLPVLLLLACIGVLGLERAFAGFVVRRRIARWGLCFLLAYSVVFNLLVSVETHAEIDFLVGNSFLSLGQLDKAMIQYQKSLALWPGGADANSGVASVYFKNGRMDDAIVQYQKTLEIRPDFVEAHNNLAYCFLQVDRVDDAITQYQMAVEIEPDSAIYHTGLGNALLQKGQINEAILEYQKALEIKPDFADVHYYLAYCLFRTERIDEAIVEYQKAIELNPKSAVFHSDLGNVLLQKGRVDDAIVQFRQAIEL
jgi:tetratricopeptide (TPR) repeat protein